MIQQRVQLVYYSGMKNVVENFIEELKNDENIRGILLFGSYARGDQRPTSDVDVLVLVKAKAWRDVFERDGQTFEMVYASFDLAKDFYASHPNDAVQQWTDGKIVYDPDGQMIEIQKFVDIIRDQGRSPLTEKQIHHLRFEKADKLSAVEYLKDKDLPTANLYLQSLCQELVELYFELHQLWTPAPKQRLKKLREIDKENADLFDTLFCSNSFEKQLRNAKLVVQKLFG